MRKKSLIRDMKVKVFGCFFAILIMLSSLFGITPGLTENVYAEPEEQPAASATTCEDSLGSLGWLVCPSTGKISEAVDFLYDKIEDILVINPVERKDGSPIYEIWKYFQGVTNLVFIGFLLVVIFSQITGWGISNYGIKKALPKIIVAAILVNLSFYICSIAVDASNIFGSGLRGVFESIETSTSGNIAGGALSNTTMSEVWASVGGGLALTIGGAVVAFETGAIWMLIPLALGALVSVVIGLITIAMRQAVVTLLIMIAPLAIVAYMLPNTEQWFRKWRHLFFQMLIFYPAFSLLFGAANIAGWAIIISSDSGFGVLIGIAVQVFPLFFSWSLMKMSGTVLGTINSKLTGLTRAPLGGVKGWASSHRELSKQKHLASRNTYTPSMKLQKFLSDRKIARDEETREHAETVKNRGLAYAASRNYKRGTEIPSKEGEEAYEAQARNAEYQKQIARHKNNMNKGLGQLEAVIQNGSTRQKARLDELDNQNVIAFDSLKMEQARGERIDYKNAKGYHDRMEQAINAHMDQVHGHEVDAKGRPTYKRHFAPGSHMERMANNRYSQLSNIMEHDLADSQYAAAAAAYGYDSQRKMMGSKVQKYMELTPPTKDVVNRIEEMTKGQHAADEIDAIVAGLRVINSRGDTDIVKAQIDNMLDKNVGGGIKLGTHASQELASFLMFDVKDSDPWLRRFGKYINLETAKVFNSNDRKNLEFNYDEYIKGYHMELDAATGQLTQMFAKKGMKELMEGTSLDNIERTALSNFDDSLKKAYSTIGADGKSHLNVAEYLRKREEVQTAIGPQFISASLKYLSGSEQLVNAVTFLTGYEHKQMKDGNGNLVLDPKTKEPMYEWKDSWSNENISDEDKGKLRKYFNGKTLQYLRDQTPAQILGLRSDYYAPLLNHLAEAYEETDTEGWTEEYVQEHEDYMREMADIQTRYGDLPPDEAKRKRDMDMKALKNKMAGAQFRQLLDAKGKLNQIYRTRRSGAANNAKDWLRGWLDLDNDVAISLKLEKDKRKEKAAQRELEKAERKRRGEPIDDSGAAPSGKVYSDIDMADFVSHVDDLWHDLRAEDDDVFFRESLEYIQKTLSADSYIAKKYEQFRKDDPYADSHMLKEYLEDLLNDPDNY